MSEPNFIEVALAADQNYIIGLTVAAYSIACNCNADSPLRFHLLISGFSEKKTFAAKSLLQNRTARYVFMMSPKSTSRFSLSMPPAE